MLNKNFHITVPSDVIIQRIVLSLQKLNEISNSPTDVYTIIGTFDHVNRIFTDEKFTILNMSWTKFNQQTGIDVWDLWPSLQVIVTRLTIHSFRIQSILE